MVLKWHGGVAVYSVVPRHGQHRHRCSEASK